MNVFGARIPRMMLRMSLFALLAGACAPPARKAPTAIGNLDSLVKASKQDPKVWQHLATAVTTGDSAIATHASELLAHAGPAALPAIRRLLQQPDARSQRLGAYALGSLGPAGAPAALELVPLLGGADSMVANMADWARTRIVPDQEPRMLTLVHDLRYGDDDSRVDAALGFAQLEADLVPVCPLLVARLADRSAPVRRAAFTTLGRAGESILPCLQLAQSQTDPEIRSAIRLLRIRLGGGGLGN